MCSQRHASSSWSRRGIAGLCLVSSLLGACQRVQETAAAETAPGGLVLQLEHRAGEQPVALGHTRLTSARGDALVLASLRYYLSQFQLIDLHGHAHALPTDAESDRGYFLVDAADPASHRLALEGFAPGTYWSIEFSVGVDAARNRAGAQTGVLDPARGMFWTWHTGYIFFALEGRQEPSGRDLAFHVGGDAQYTRRVRLPLQQGVVVNAGAEARPLIRVIADVGGLLAGDPAWNLAQVHGAAEVEPSVRLAEAYGHMFRLEHESLAFAGPR
jgi:hypothetical protein